MRLKITFWTFIVSYCTLLQSATSQQQQQQFRIRPQDKEVIEGQTIRIFCEVSNQAGNVQWSKDGFVLGFDRSITGFKRYYMEGDPSSGVHTLVIENAQVDDDADYQCQVTPSKNGRVKGIRASAHLTVLLPPKKVEIVGYENGSVKEVRQQDTVQLKCVVEGGKPNATIKWYRKNIELRPDNVISKITDGEQGRKDVESTITLNPNPDDNGASYTCEAWHQALPTPVRTTVQLSVLFPPGPPEITGYQEGETVTVKDTLTLTCTSRGGNPLAQLVWYKNDQQVDFSYTRTGKESVNTYTLSVLPSDNNAIYKCEATNSVSPQPRFAMVKLTVNFSPDKVTITGPTDAKAGDVVNMKCVTARSNPPAEISWVVDGRPIKANSTIVTDPEGGWLTSSDISITITEQERNMKMFSCYGLNQQLGDAVVETHVLSVLYPPDPPSIFGYTEGTSIRAGNLQRITCVTHGGNPLPTLKWKKNNVELKSTVTTNGNVVTNELAIISDKNDNGVEYVCDASNSATPTALSTRIKLTVNFPPSAVTIKMDPRKPKAGQTVTLTCDSDSSNPASEISWWRDGFIQTKSVHEKLQDGLFGGKVTHNVLQLNISAADDGAVYTCQAANHVLQLSVHDAITLSVYYKPEIVSTEGKEIVIEEGKQKVINLTVLANPSDIAYTWSRNGQDVPTITSTQEQNDISSNHVFSSGPILNISGAQKGDAGNYTCKAKNEEGITEYTLFVQVHYAAEIEEVAGPGMVDEGSTVHLECIVDALPWKENTVTWSREGFDMTRANKQESNGRSFLTIYNVSASDSGDFKCGANNGIGETDEKSVTVVVKHKPSIRSLPQFDKAASDAGADAKITCSASGAPNVTFTWYRQGGIISETTHPTKYANETTQKEPVIWEGVLTVKDVKSKDYGIYECVARNELGFDSKKITLSGTTHPDAPASLRILNVTYNGVIIDWVPGFDGGVEQSFRVRYKKVNTDSYSYQDITNTNETSFFLTGLDLDTEYTFSLLAYNSVGEGPYTQEIIKARTSAERPVTETERVITEVLSGKGEVPRIIIISVSVVGTFLLILNVILVICFVRKRRKKRLEEESDQSSSKAATIEMYAPSSYNETVNGETMSSTSEKSEAYSDGHSTGGYSEEPGKPAASTYLIDQGDGVYIPDGNIAQYSPYRYAEEVISSLNRSPKERHRGIPPVDDGFYVEAVRRNVYNQSLDNNVNGSTNNYPTYGKMGYPPPPVPGRTSASGAPPPTADIHYNGGSPDPRYIPFPVSPAGTRTNTSSSHLSQQPVLSTFNPNNHHVGSPVHSPNGRANHVTHHVTQHPDAIMIREEMDGHLV